MSEHDADATPVTSTMYTPLLPKHPRLRFIEGTGDGAAGDEDKGDQQGDDDTDTETGGDGDDAGTDELGDKGKQALDRMKAERKAAKDEAKAAIARAEAAEAALANKDKPADEVAIDAAKAEARREAIEAANKRILRSELKALATGKLADPSDAHLYINLDDFDVNDDGDVDSDALSEAIDELLTKKPHLAAQKPNRFTGNGDQGTKGKDAKPAQLSRTDLQGMSSEEIVAAKAEGRLNDLLGITT